MKCMNYRIEMERKINGYVEYENEYVYSMAELKYFIKNQIPEGFEIIQIKRCFKDGAAEIIKIKR